MLVASPAAAAEIKNCQAPHAPVSLVNYTPATSRPVMTAHLGPMLTSGLQVPWGTLGSKLGIAMSGPSNMAQVSDLFIARMKSLHGTQTGKGKDIYYAKGAQWAVSTRQWADPNHPAWANLLAKFGPTLNNGLTPAQVGVVIHMHTMTEWALQGQMTPAQVAAVMANYVAKGFTNVKLFVLLDMTSTAWAWRVNQDGSLGAAGAGPGGSYEEGEIIEHPSMQAIAGEGVILANVAQTQAGVPNGAEAEYSQMASKPLDCAAHLSTDGIHYTTKPAGGGTCTVATCGKMFVGYAIADWLAWWPPFRDALPWLP